MPLNLARRLVGPDRTAEANRALGWMLAFVAGALNAGGFLAVRQYTSHMTGIASAMANNLVTGHFGLLLDGLVAVLAFLAGAMCTAVLVNLARRKRLSTEYALPLLLEALLILCFGLMGARLEQMRELLLPLTVVLLCFIMGLQNAVATKLSNSVIRTTHMTGVVTDLGIELGKLVYRNDPAVAQEPVRADRARLLVLGGLLGSFVSGGAVGAYGFELVGYQFTVPIALALAAAAAVPFMDDWRAAVRDA